jgi:hypothetical protein
MLEINNARGQLFDLEMERLDLEATIRAFEATRANGAK